jgi:hypothetical protein
MYTIEFDGHPKKLVVPSQLSAEREFRDWLTNNNYSEILDGDGHPWKLELTIEEPPTDDRKNTSFVVTLLLKSSLSGRALVRDRTLSANDDARLLERLADAEIPIRMTPITLKSLKKDDMRRFLAEKITTLRSELKARSLKDLKRMTVGRWIDERAVFGVE